MRLKEAQVPLVAAVRRDGDRPAGGRTFPIERQKEFELKVVERFGFDHNEWRLDSAVHPFAIVDGTTDIRLTTRYFEDNLDGLFGTMHECGHGLYEHGVARELERTPSPAARRSVSTSRRAACGRTSSAAACRSGASSIRSCARSFPEALADVELEDWYSAVNWVEPSLIRVEADEATYNLHIILRFELEQELIADDDRRSRSCRRCGTSACASTSASSRRTTGWACCRTCTGRSARSATSPRTRSETSSAASSGSRSPPSTPPARELRGRRVRRAGRVAARPALAARPQVHAA